MKRLAHLALLLTLTACSDPPAAAPHTAAGGRRATPAPPPTTPPARPQSQRPGDLEPLLETDRRTVGDALRQLAAGSTGQRTRAAGLLARARSPEARRLLRLLAHDDDATVRRAAAAAWGQQLDDAETAERELLATLAAAPEDDERAAATRALGRVATDASDAALLAALAAPSASLRAAACHAVGVRSAAGRTPGSRIRAGLAAAGQSPLDSAVAEECAFALARSGQDDATQSAIAAATAALLHNASPDARALACRPAALLGALPLPLLQALLDDPELRVQVAAARAVALRSAGNPAAQRAALVTLANPERRDRSLHPLLALLDALEGHADTRLLPDLQRLARELAQQARRAGGQADRSLGVLHCVLARVIDRLTGRPTATPHCGLRLLPPPDVAVHHAEVVAALTELPSFVRGDTLLRLYRLGPDRVRIAVLTAAADLDDPRIAGLVTEALAGRDPGMIASAADLVAAHPERYRAEDQPRPDTVRALGRALATPHVEARLSALKAAERLADPTLRPAIEPLLRSANPDVRRAAAAAWRACGGDTPPEAPRDAVEHSISANDLQLLPATAQIETSRGTVRVSLERDDAPTTVARFAELARAGFFDGLTWHRVVPGFVVQGGDPRGDGYGGPDWTQRCEDRPDRPYRRGTLGMALAGRDTGGSQFFVTYGRQPHLDGAYTPFGQVEDGMEVLERLLPGDRIVHVEVREPPASPEAPR